MAREAEVHREWGTREGLNKTQARATSSREPQIINVFQQFFSRVVIVVRGALL